MARAFPASRAKRREAYKASLAAAIAAIDNPVPGAPNPDGYGKIYAVAPNGDSFVLDRRESYDRARSPHGRIEWAVHVKRQGDKRYEWNETYATRREAVAWIRGEVNRIIEAGNRI